jgi:hypothetical protein
MKIMPESLIYWSEIIAAAIGFLILSWILVSFLERKRQAMDEPNVSMPISKGLFSKIDAELRQCPSGDEIENYRQNAARHQARPETDARTKHRWHYEEHR